MCWNWGRNQALLKESAIQEPSWDWSGLWPIESRTGAVDKTGFCHYAQSDQLRKMAHTHVYRKLHWQKPASIMSSTNSLDAHCHKLPLTLTTFKKGDWEHSFNELDLKKKSHKTLLFLGTAHLLVTGWGKRFSLLTADSLSRRFLAAGISQTLNSGLDGLWGCSNCYVPWITPERSEITFQRPLSGSHWNEWDYLQSTLLTMRKEDIIWSWVNSQNTFHEEAGSCACTVRST